jgi:hypothetical protein
MPDITMCASSDCPLAGNCYRSRESGTVPTERRQAWSVFGWVTDARGAPCCQHYWPVIREGKGSTP